MDRAKTTARRDEKYSFVLVLRNGWHVESARASSSSLQLAQQHIRNALQWRHNERDSVSNHHPYNCFFNRSFRRRSKKTSKLRVTGLCAGNSPVTENLVHGLSRWITFRPYRLVMLLRHIHVSLHVPQMLHDASAKTWRYGWYGPGIACAHWTHLQWFYDCTKINLKNSPRVVKNLPGSGKLMTNCYGKNRNLFRNYDIFSLCCDIHYFLRKYIKRNKASTS